MSEASPPMSPTIAPEIALAWGLAYDDFLEEAWPLIRAHWAEVGSHRDILSLNPDHDRYRVLERARSLHILTARHEGELVGYMFVLVTRHPRDREAMVATDDIIYARPSYRASRIGPRMLAEALRHVEALGVNIVFFREKAWRGSGGYLKRWGFSEQERVYAKVLRPPHPTAEPGNRIDASDRYAAWLAEEQRRATALLIAAAP